MRKKFRFLICALLFTVFALAIAAACNGNGEGGQKGSEYTLTFVTNTEESFDAITAKAGEDISARLPDYKDTDAYYFGGWYTAADLTGESVDLPATMPAEDTTYYARWYVTYSVEKYLQKADLSGYETESAESLAGEVNKGAVLPTRVTNFLAADPEGFVLVTSGELGTSRNLTLSGRDNALKMYFDRMQYMVVYNANLPDDVVVQGEMDAEYAVYGVEHALSQNRFAAEGYRFAGWSLDPAGGELVDRVTPTELVFVYAIWDKALTDIYGGADRIYIPHAEEGVAYLERAELGEKVGTYEAATSVFTFGQGSTVLSGKVIGESFFYFKDIWQSVFTSEEGATLELKADGSAVLVEGGHTVEGTYSIDMASGYFVFDYNGVERLFVLNFEGDERTFSFSGSEQGWYALQTEDGFGYDLLFLDGFGRMSVYAVSPQAPDFDPYFDVYSGTYALDDEDIYLASYAWGVYTSTFPFKLSPADGKELDGVKLKGTYIFGDYRGTFTDLDYEYNSLFLDGFGHGIYGGYYKTEGTYTIEDVSWAVDNYPTPGQYTESIVMFTAESGEVTKFAIFGEFYLEVSAEFYGRYEFEVVPESIYPGSRGDVAFMYFSGYTIYVDGSFNDAAIWFGNYEPKYSTSGYTEADLPLYDWRDDGSVFRTEKPNTFRYVSAWEDVSFEFEITAENKIRWHIADEDVVFYDANGEKIYIDTFGAGRYAHDGVVDEVPFGYNAFLRSDSLRVEAEEDFEYLMLYSFFINGEFRSFTYTAPLTAVGMGGELTDLKEVDYVAFVGNIGLLIAYKDGTGTVGLDMSIYGGTGYWFAITGKISHPNGLTDVWQFKADGEAPKGDDEEESEEYRLIFERLGNLNFKLAEGEEGIYDCLEADGILYDITCELGTLVTDGYGTAVFTPVGGQSYTCSYSMQGDALYLLCEKEAYADWYLIITEDGTSFTYAGEEAGIFFSYDDYGEIDTSNLLIFNGKGQVSGYYDGAWLEGSYTATGESFILNGISLKEFKLEIALYGDAGNIFEVYVIVGLAPSDVRIGYLFFRDESATGSFTVVNEKNETVGTLRSDGYTAAVYERENGMLRGELHVGHSVNSARTNRYGERDFVLDVHGSSVIFFDENGNEYLFDIVSGSNVMLRTLEYGVYASYSDGQAGVGLLTLDGHGGAVLSNGEGQATNAFYEPFAETGASFRLFDENGETLFIFNLALVNNEEKDDDRSYGYLYVYRLYSASASGVYINEDWTVLTLNGFGDACYIDRYGVETYYEAIPIDGASVLLRAYGGGESRFVSLGESTFEFITREFIVSEEGTLLAYNGKGGAISLSDDVLRIAEGVFDGVEITHVDFNKVEVIEAYVFAGQSLDGVDAPNLRIIGERAFAGITYYDFEEVNIPQAVEIGEAAFIGCTYLTSVKLGAIERIGTQAFAGSGYSYGSFIIDMGAVNNAEKVEIASTAFLALNSNSFRIVVKDIATVNGVLQNSSWPVKALESLILWYDPDAYGADYLFSATEGAMFELENGTVRKAVADKDGETLLTVVGLYEERGNTLSLYSKQGGLFATTAVTADTSKAYSVTVGESIAFSSTSWGEVHTLNTPDGKVEFYASVSGSSYSTAYVSRYTVNVSNVVVTVGANTSAGGDATFDTMRGALEFGITTGGDIVRYLVRVTSSTECVLEKIGTQKTITTADGAFNVKFLVNDAGAPVQLVTLEKKYEYYDSAVTVLSCEIEWNVFVVEYIAASNMNDTVKFTYHAESETITTELVKHVYNASNLYMDGLWVTVAFVFGSDLKITEVRSFSIGESYGAGEAQEIVNAVYHDNGSATFTLANGDKYNLAIAQGAYSYEVSITKAN